MFGGSVKAPVSRDSAGEQRSAGHRCRNPGPQKRNEVLLEQWERLFETIRVYYTPVTAAELRQGVRPREEAELSEFLDALICLPIEADIGLLAGDYLRQFAPSHGLELGDALIAATAIVHDCTLWTRNRKHYPMKGIAHFHM